MEQCSKFNCNSRLRETYRGTTTNNYELEPPVSSSHTITEASQYRKISPSRPQCRKAVDNLMPEGYFTVSTELSSNFTPLSTRRPSSARDEYRRRRDTLRTEGNVSYQVEGKSAYRAHKTSRPKIYKPRPCGDCSEQRSDNIQVSTTSRTDNETHQEDSQPREEIKVKTPETPAVVRVEDKKGQVSNKSDVRRPRGQVEVTRPGGAEDDLQTDWPCWSSQPVTLGEHVRSVFLDLCTGVTASQLQQTYPHHWGVLLSRLAHRPDLKLQLLERVNRRE